MTQFDKFLILSPPKSGSHMLSRMISRSTGLKWNVTAIDINLNNFINDSWIIAMHVEFTKEINNFCKKNNICLIGLTRDIGHKESIERDPFLNFDLDKINKIKQSIPKKIRISYDNLVFSNTEKELNKLKKITKLKNIELEKWEDRYPHNPRWRKNFI